MKNIFLFICLACFGSIALAGKEFTRAALVTESLFYLSMENIQSCNCDKVSKEILCAIKIPDKALLEDRLLLKTIIKDGTKAAVAGEAHLDEKTQKWINNIKVRDPSNKVNWEGDGTYCTQTAIELMRRTEIWIVVLY